MDPTYNPAAWSGNVTGIRFVDSFNMTGVFHLHDNNRYPHNRVGFRANASYKFNEGAARSRPEWPDWIKREPRSTCPRHPRRPGSECAQRSRDWIRSGLGGPHLLRVRSIPPST